MDDAHNTTEGQPDVLQEICRGHGRSLEPFIEACATSLASEEHVRAGG